MIPTMNYGSRAPRPSDTPLRRFLRLIWFLGSAVCFIGVSWLSIEIAVHGPRGGARDEINALIIALCGGGLLALWAIIRWIAHGNRP
jgi:hypothetical protein